MNARMEIDLRPTDLDNENHLVPVNIREHPLEWLLSKDLIDSAQHIAGDKLRRDWQISSISPLQAAEIAERVDTSISLTVPANRLDALRRVKRALSELNPVSRLIAIALCGEGLWLKEIAAKYGFSRDYIGPRAREALDDLARHYKLA